MDLMESAGHPFCSTLPSRSWRPCRRPCLRQRPRPPRRDRAGPACAAQAFLEDQRLGLAGQPQGIVGRVTGQDAPEAIRVRVIVQAAGEAMDRHDEAAVGLLGLGDEAGVVGHPGGQFLLGLAHTGVPGDDAAGILCLEGLGHRPPILVGEGLLADNNGVRALRRRAHVGRERHRHRGNQHRHTQDTPRGPH